MIGSSGINIFQKSTSLKYLIEQFFMNVDEKVSLSVMVNVSMSKVLELIRSKEGDIREESPAFPLRSMITLLILVESMN